jgi:hypothetical protein
MIDFMILFKEKSEVWKVNTMFSVLIKYKFLQIK